MAVLAHDGAELWYEVAGDGPALLLITGLGYPSDTWWRVLPWLNERFTTVRVDNRGVGRTGTGAARPYTVPRMAADALAVLAAAGITHAHVWGVSMGGTIAQELALTAPGAVDRLVLGCTHPGRPDLVIDADALTLLAERGTVTPLEAARMSIPFIYGATTPAAEIERDIAVRMANPTSPEGYAAQREGALEWEGSGARLTSLTARTLVIHGDADRLVPVANGRFLAEHIPGARLEVLPGASHIFWTDAPERTRETVLDFLTAPEYT